ncbi:MAG TPA: bacillithiol biosynthesis BshC, partial [Cyclobacteriaceae bacterium]|nr:bacillithiol biosynthesis BshC [Cyclobacteriaceae bacterium]
MRVQKLDFSETRSFSSFFLDYIQQTDSLKSFYSRFPLLENFEGQIKEKSKSFSQQQRDILYQALTQQYQDIEVSDKVKNNLTSLKNSNTFTVTTGHQLNVFTGPLYFVYKIVTVINACKKLKQQYPAYDFVPVYWMASEDHDYEEIKSLRVQGKKYTWVTQQTGAVGRFNTQGLTELANEIPGDTTLFKTAYSKGKTLSSAARQYVNQLFQQEGIVVIDADDANLKKALIP